MNETFLPVMNMNSTKTKDNGSSFTTNCELTDDLGTSSDFGIPLRLLAGFKEKMAHHKKLRLYLNSLLERFRSGHFQKLPIFIGPNTKYQNNDQCLEYFSFRPYVKDWAELMFLARARGSSATLLFIILLELDLQNPVESDFEREGDKKNEIRRSKNAIKFFQILKLDVGLWRRSLKSGRSSDKIYKSDSLDQSQ